MHFTCSGERTFGVLTKLDLMDKGTNALDVLSLSLESLENTEYYPFFYIYFSCFSFCSFVLRFSKEDLTGCNNHGWGLLTDHKLT